MDALKRKALARASLRSDPEVRKRMEEEGLEFEDVFSEYWTVLQEEEDGEEEGQPRVRVTATLLPPSGGPPRMTIPSAVLALLEEAGRPMARMEIYEEAVRRGWIERADSPHKVMGTAVRRLISRDHRVVEIPGKKPRQIALPKMVKGRQTLEDLM